MPNGCLHLLQRFGQKLIDCNGLGNKKALGGVYGKIDDGGQLQTARMIIISATSSQVILPIVHSGLLFPSMNSRATTYIPNSYSEDPVFRKVLPCVDALDGIWVYGNRPRFQCLRSPVL